MYWNMLLFFLVVMWCKVIWVCLKVGDVWMYLVLLEVIFNVMMLIEWRWL